MSHLHSCPVHERNISPAQEPSCWTCLHVKQTTEQHCSRTFWLKTLQSVSPSELFAGDDCVVVGKKFLVNADFNFGQQAANAAGRLAWFGCGVLLMMLEPGSVSRVAACVWTFGDHGVVFTKKSRWKVGVPVSPSGSIHTLVPGHTLSVTRLSRSFWSCAVCALPPRDDQSTTCSLPATRTAAVPSVTTEILVNWQASCPITWRHEKRLLLLQFTAQRRHSSTSTTTKVLLLAVRVFEYLTLYVILILQVIFR